MVGGCCRGENVAIANESRGRPKMVESQGGCFDIGSVGYQKEAVLLERRGWLGRMAEVGRDDGITETK